MERIEFPELLESLIQAKYGSRRLFIAKAQPDANQAGALSYLSQVLTRKRPPPPEHVTPWADALNLKGTKRDDFLILAALEHIPVALRDRVRDVYEKSVR